MVWKAFEVSKYVILHANDGEKKEGIVTSDKVLIACFGPQGNYIGNIRFTEVDKIQPPSINPNPDIPIVNM